MPETSLILRGPSALLVGRFPGLTLHGAGEERDRASYMGRPAPWFCTPIVCPAAGSWEQPVVFSKVVVYPALCPGYLYSHPVVQHTALSLWTLAGALTNTAGHGCSSVIGRTCA